MRHRNRHAKAWEIILLDEQQDEEETEYDSEWDSYMSDIGEE